MGEGSMGDEVYQPTDDEEGEDAGALDMADALGEDDDDQILDKGYSPPERPYALGGSGTTAREQREGESLDQRLAEEVPDVGGTDAAAEGDGLGDDPDSDGEPVDPEAGAERAGRLLAPDQDPTLGTSDDIAAADVGVDGGAASAEEAAVHRVDDPDGDRM